MMITRLRHFFLFFFVFSVFSNTLYAEQLTRVTVEWAPFNGTEMPNNGVITVLVKSAFKRSGISSSIRFIPWSRAMRDVKNGKSDILMGAYYTNERNKDYYFSDSIYDIEIGLVALKSLGITQFTKLQDLIPYKIGVNRGWANSKTFDKADYLNKQDANSPILNVRKLLKKRVDMLFISFGVFRHEINTISAQKINEVVFIKPTLKISPIHLMISRNNPEKENIMNAFNESLAAMKKDGSYQKIIKEYGF